MCKRRRRRGWNGGRRIWKREDGKNRAKWWKRKGKWTPRRVRRRVRRVTARRPRTTAQRRSGAPNRGRRKGARRRKRKSKQSLRRRRGPLRLSKHALRRKEGSNQRRIRRDERRGNIETREALRRYRGGRVSTLSEGKRRRSQNAIEKWSWKYEVENTRAVKVQKIGLTNFSELNYQGRRVKEESWRVRKDERRRSQYWRGKRWRNGRTSRGYIMVDYKTGTRILKRNPRQGEMVRPRRMWRKRS